MRSPRARASRPARAAIFLAVACCGCTAVDTSTVKQQRDAGITRSYGRPPADLYRASVAALENLQSTPDWRDLRIVERDPGTGTVIAERDLDSAVIPGLGERDAIGIFVAEAPGGDSDVTVVRMSSDQIPGSVGTTINTARDASGLLFPAIDEALEAIPETPRPQVAAVAPPAATATSAPPTRLAQAPATAGAATLIDRVYAVLRDGGTWRPLVRELTAAGAEEVRVGRWAVLTDVGGRVQLEIRGKDASPADAARLALDLQRAGFDVDVVSAPR
jgi:hypothetical protein